MSEASRQQVSNSSNTVVFMKLFLDDGFTLDEHLKSFKEAAIVYGERAEERVVAFLARRGITARGAGII